MMNEMLFSFHILCLGSAVLAALFASKEALITLTAIFTLLANLFVTKQITLFNLHVTATDAFAVGSILGMNILQEYYGNKTARQAIGIGFCAALFFILVSAIHLCYIPNNFDQCHTHFMAILQPMPRIIIASLITYLLSQNLDHFLFTYFKKKFPHHGIVMRFWSSTVISQFFDTVLFSFLGLYGVIHNIGHLIVVSYAIKLLVLALSTPFAWLSTAILNKGRAS